MQLHFAELSLIFRSSFCSLFSTMVVLVLVLITQQGGRCAASLVLGGAGWAMPVRCS